MLNVNPRNVALDTMLRITSRPLDQPGDRKLDAPLGHRTYKPGGRVTRAWFDKLTTASRYVPLRGTLDERVVSRPQNTR
jgi:hypothetical protein